MKIRIQNLGPLSDVTIEPSNLTILTGTNNTGKTYAMYCLWAALNPPLAMETNYAKLKFLKPMAKKLADEKKISFNILETIKQNKSEFDSFFSDRLTRLLPEFFNSGEVILPTTSLSVEDYVARFCDLNLNELPLKLISTNHELVMSSFSDDTVTLKIQTFEDYYNYLKFIEGELGDESQEGIENQENFDKSAHSQYLALLNRLILVESLVEALGDILIGFFRLTSREDIIEFSRIMDKNFIDSTTFIPASRTGLNITYPDLMRIAAAKSRRDRNKIGRNPRFETDLLLEAQYAKPIDKYLTMLGYGH